MKSKNVCFFNSNMAWGGGEKWHLTTCIEFKRRGYKTFLITNTNSQIGVRGVQEEQDVHFCHIGNLSFINPVKIFRMVKFFRTHKIDAVVLNLPSDLKLGGIAAKLAGVKKIIYRRGTARPLRNTFLNRFLFTKVLTHVIIISKEVGRCFTRGNESWFPEEKMVLMYNAVDTSKPIDKSRKIYEKDEEELVIGSAGRLSEEKGHKYLIELAKILKTDGLRFKVLIAGTGKLRENLQKMIDDNGLGSEVKLLGHVDDMPAFLNSLDLFVFTSLYEGGASALIETLQYGVPIIAWNISSNPEIIEDGITGGLVEPFDVEKLSLKVKSMVTSKEDIEKIIDQGHAKVEKMFDFKRNLDLLEDILS